MQIEMYASLEEFRFTSAGRELRFRPVLWVAGNKVLAVGQPPPGLSDDSGIRIFMAPPHPMAMDMLICLIRHGVRGFRRPGILGRLLLPKLHIRIGRDVNRHMCGFAKDIFFKAAIYSGAVRRGCELAE